MLWTGATNTMTRLVIDEVKAKCIAELSRRDPDAAQEVRSIKLELLPWTVAVRRGHDLRIVSWWQWTHSAWPGQYTDLHVRAAFGDKEAMGVGPTVSCDYDATRGHIVGFPEFKIGRAHV